ncbi:hypothetical protein LTR64_006601 [Lithohypha guttulata]|uniref:uncharacterized protein n=1 Tax=Lithohypha guttulata TaxID=1690604 RepID=UPI00315C538E
MSQAFELPVLIVGGGLVGLTLAQALQKAGIACIVYERDYALETEHGGGWAITVHWALEALRECLPSNLFQRLDDIQVDREQGIKDTGRFLFLDMATGKPKYEVPPSPRKRVNRRLLRNLLGEGIDIRFNKRLKSFEIKDDKTVMVRFEDSSSVCGSLLIGCDGSNSKVRHLLFGDRPEEARLYRLPVRAMGATVRMTENQIFPLRRIDPLLFQGCHPETGIFLWYSTISTPALNGSEGRSEPYYEGQLIISWKYVSCSDEVPTGNMDRIRKLRSMVSQFEESLRVAVENVSEDTEIKEIRLQDWPTRPWLNHGGLVTLAGDSGHAMTMYRGEAFNHGVTDVASLLKQLVRVRDGSESLQSVVPAYDTELLARTHEAVLLSRQACIDAHDPDNLSSDSPLVSKRARILVSAKEVSEDAVDTGGHEHRRGIRGEELLGSYTKDGYAWFMRTDLEQKCEDYARNFVLTDRDVTVLACREKCGEGAEKQLKTGGWKLIRS